MAHSPCYSEIIHWTRKTCVLSFHDERVRLRQNQSRFQQLKTRQASPVHGTLLTVDVRNYDRVTQKEKNLRCGKTFWEK